MINHVLQNLAVSVRGVSHFVWWVMVGVVLSFAWGIGLLAGLFGLRREPSPVAMLSMFALGLLAVLGHGIGFNLTGAVGDIQAPTAAVAFSTQRTSTAMLHPLASDAQGRGTLHGREASRQRPRGRHEDQHLRQLLDAASQVQSKVETDNPSGAKPTQEKSQLAGNRECKVQGALGPGRVISLETRGGGEYGLVSFRDTLPLNRGEVVFTFDDGPHPVRTPQVLEILDRYCIKAVFFLIGDMAARSPELVREIKRRGHTIGTHTWSHPVSLGFLSEQTAEDEIEHGFTAVSQAAGEPIAPFFRFPGLGHTRRLLEYAARRDFAVWSVDAVSGDSEGASAGRLPSLLMSRLEKHGRGVLLFHDIKKTTVEALPEIIEQLRGEGYRAAQVVPATPFSADPAMIARLEARRTQAAELRHRGRYR